MRVLVTGITGFVGGDVARALLAAGHDVVGLSRDPGRAGLDVPVVAGDASESATLERALAGADAAYYLIHSLESGNDEGFEDRDRRIAERFAAAAQKAGVSRVVLFGVPEPVDPARASPHFRSRAEVERILLGALPGALSLRSWFVLSARTPVLRFTLRMIDQPAVVLGPWRDTRTNPVAASDVTAALVAALTATELPSRRLDVMGPETVTLADLWRRLAAELGGEREFVTFDEPPPPGAVRQLAASLGADPELIAPLTESLAVGDVLPRHDAARALGLEPRPLDEAIAAAVAEYRSVT